MGLGQAIKRFFLPGKPETLVVNTPLEIQKDLEKDPKYKALKQAYTSIQIENIKLKKKINEKAEQKKEIEELKDFEGKLLKQKEIDKKLEKTKSIIMPLKGVRKLPVLLTRSKRPLGQFAGFLSKDTRDGITIWYLVIKIPMKGIQKLNVYSRNPFDFFKSLLNLTQQIKSGVIETNIEMTSDNKLTIIKDQDVMMELARREYGADVKILRMDEVERADYERQIATIQEEKKNYLNIISELKEREVKYEDEINEANMNNAYLQKDRDIQAAHSSNLQNKQLAFVTATAKSVSAIQEAKMESTMAESMSESLLNTVDILRDKMATYLSQDKLESAMQDVQEILMRGVEIQRQAQAPTKSIPRIIRIHIHHAIIF